MIGVSRTGYLRNFLRLGRLPSSLPQLAVTATVNVAPLLQLLRRDVGGAGIAACVQVMRSRKR